MHFQLKDKQTKFIYVSSGKILDIVVNLRHSSKDFGKVSKFLLKQGDLLFIPSHYAHGYECLENNTLVFYHLEKYRNSKYESGVKFDDKKLKIKWKTKKPILSKRDQNHMSFEEFKNKYITL